MYVTLGSPSPAYGSVVTCRTPVVQFVVGGVAETHALYHFLLPVFPFGVWEGKEQSKGCLWHRYCAGVGVKDHGSNFHLGVEA